MHLTREAVRLPLPGASAGRVESCMECHVKAKQDRLFGLPQVKADAPAQVGSSILAAESIVQVPVGGVQELHGDDLRWRLAPAAWPCARGTGR